MILYPKFSKNDEGLYAYNPDSNNSRTEIIKWTNDEGVVSYWKKSRPEIDNTRIMLTFEEIKEFGLDYSKCQCKSKNGNKIYGDKVLQKINQFSDGSIEYKVWTREEKSRFG